MWPSRKRLRSKHLSEGDLIAYLDGESTAPDEMRRHLEGCWECRVRCEQTGEAIREFMIHRAQKLDQNWQPADRWHILAARLTGIENDCTPGATRSGVRPTQENAGDRLRQRVPGPPASAGWRWSRILAPQPLACAAGLAIAVMWLLVRQPATVSAAEVLRRSESIEAASLRATKDPVVHRTLTATSEPGSRKATWELWRAANAAQYRERISGSAETISEIKTLFQKNQLDPQLPLSVAAYRSWERRANAAGPALSVIRASNGERVYLIAARSSRAAGEDEIAETRLAIRERDWHPIAYRFTAQVKHQKREYSLVEASHELVPFEQVASVFFPPAGRDVAPTLRLEPSNKPAPALPQPALLSNAEVWTLEFEVNEALHRLSACSEEAPQVTSRPEGVTVKGLTDTEGRKQDLLRALAPISARGFLDVDIKTVEEAVEEATRTGGRAVTEPLSSNPFGTRAGPAGEKKLPAEAWLEKAGLDQKSILDLSDRALSESRTLLQEAWALRRLADRYGERQPPSGVSQVYAARLNSMMRDHLNAIGSKGEALRQILQQAGAAGTQGTAAEPPALRANSESWATASATLLAAARSLDALVVASFSRQTGGGGTDPEPSSLEAALAALEVSLDDVRAALDRPPGRQFARTEEK